LGPMRGVPAIERGTHLMGNFQRGGNKFALLGPLHLRRLFSYARKCYSRKKRNSSGLKSRHERGSTLGGKREGVGGKNCCPKGQKFTERKSQEDNTTKNLWFDPNHNQAVKIVVGGRGEVGSIIRRNREQWKNY